MCGITGFVGSAELGPWFGHAIDAIRHRGPDGDGVWYPGLDAAVPAALLRQRARTTVPAALGHLRLSIIDLSATGAQPMIEPGRAALVSNGEIYNYIELGEELRALGWTFAGSSDTEVLLKGWLQWGPDLLPKLNGMWAFAIWDDQRKGMLLCRDRFGEKPLFVAEWRGGVAFASEIKALLRFPGISADLDDRMIGHLLHSGRAYDGSSTWFRGITQLEPGTALWIGQDGRRTYRYYDLEHAVERTARSRRPDEWVDRLDQALDDSVRLRMRSDVAIGGCLSAGVDSAAIATTAVVHPLATNYQSFTLGSDDVLIDERPQASALASKIGSTWHAALASPEEFAASFDKIVWHQETPLTSTSLYGQWKVFTAARVEGVPVLLDGQGADEILGGYNKFYVSHVRTALRRNPAVGAKEAVRLARHLGASPRLLKYAHRYLPSRSSDPGPMSLLTGLGTSQALPDVGRGVLGMRIDDIRRWSLPNLLSYEDRNAMAHAIESRLPFLDPAVVELALAMPDDVLFHDGWTKWPLRAVLDRRGSPDVAWRRGKRQFFVPQSEWLRTALAPMIDELRATPHPMWSELKEANGVEAFIDHWRATPGRTSSDEACFHILSIDRFFRAYFP